MFWHRVAFASYFIRALASKDTIAQSAELRCDLNVQPRLVCDDINAKGLYEVVSILYGAQLTVAVGQGVAVMSAAAYRQHVRRVPYVTTQPPTLPGCIRAISRCASSALWAIELTV
jgi:hypothetical protein